MLHYFGFVLEGFQGQPNTISSTNPSSTTERAATTEYVPWLYRFGQKLMPCLDNIPSDECERHDDDCEDALHKREMALFCCGTCRAKHPNFLPKQSVQKT
uniref:Uncharacterized protein n=1 Tax=Globodera rostochiensis TaxID=31243 RepID=A0A914HF80_GLORO